MVCGAIVHTKSTIEDIEGEISHSLNNFTKVYGDVNFGSLMLKNKVLKINYNNISLMRETNEK